MRGMGPGEVTLQSREPRAVSDEGREICAVEVPDALFRFAVARLTDEAFITLDRAGLVTSWNPGAERLLGYARKRALGLHVSAIVPSNERGAGVGAHGLDEARRRGSVSADRWLRHEDGSGRDCHTTILAV